MYSLVPMFISRSHSSALVKSRDLNPAVEPAPEVEAPAGDTFTEPRTEPVALAPKPLLQAAPVLSAPTVSAASLQNLSNPSQALSGRTSVPPGSVAIVLPDGSRHPQNVQHYSTPPDVQRVLDALKNAGLGDFSGDVRAENVIGLSAPPGVEQYTIRGCNVGLMLQALASGNLQGVALDLAQQGSGGWQQNSDGGGARRVDLGALSTFTPAAAVREQGAAPTPPGGPTSVAPGSVAIVMPDGSRHVQNERHYSTQGDVQRLLQALRDAGLGDLSREVRAENVSGLSAPPGVQQFTIRGCNVGLMLASLQAGNLAGVALDLAQQAQGTSS